jgi:hypothetical protein
MAWHAGRGLPPRPFPLVKPSRRVNVAPGDGSIYHSFEVAGRIPHLYIDSVERAKVITSPFE